MLSVKVWCLPPVDEEMFKGVYRKIVEKVREIPQLSNSEEHTILVLFPSDNMNFGIGEEILIEAEFQAPVKNPETVGYVLANKLGELFQGSYPQSYVAVKVKGFDGGTTGYWPEQKI